MELGLMAVYGKEDWSILSLEVTWHKAWSLNTSDNDICKTPVQPSSIKRVHCLLFVATKEGRMRGVEGRDRYKGKDSITEMMTKWLTFCCHSYPKHSLMRLGTTKTSLFFL